MDRYEEAMSRCKQWEREHTKGYVIQDMIEFIFPELANEDEKIKRAISYAIAQVKHEDGILIDRITEDMALAWLEKQKEQKPTHLEKTIATYKLSDERSRDMMSSRMEGRQDVINNPEEYGLRKNLEWSEEDKEMIKALIRNQEILIDSASNEQLRDIYSKEIQWLKSLQPQPSSQSNTNHTVWHNASEEKPTKLPIIHIWYHGNRVNAVTHEDTCLQAELDDINFQPDDKWAYVEDLLTVQPHWKPSEEQMDALKNSAYGTYQNGDGPALRELYNDLKKLM